MHIRPQRLGSLYDVAQIGLVVFIEGSRNADDHRVHLGYAAEIVGGGKSDAQRLPHFFRLDALNVGAAGIQSVDLLAIDVEAGDDQSLAAIEQHQRQADVAQPDDADLGGTGFNLAFQRVVRRQDSLRMRHSQYRSNAAGEVSFSIVTRFRAQPRVLLTRVGYVNIAHAHPDR